MAGRPFPVGPAIPGSWFSSLFRTRLAVAVGVELLGRRLDADLRGPVIKDAQAARRLLGQIDLAPCRIRSPVVDLDIDLLAGIEIDDGDVRSERQLLVRSGQGILVVALPARGLPAVERWAIPGRHAGFESTIKFSGKPCRRAHSR